MRRIGILLLLLVLPCLLPAQEVIEKIEIVGNNRVNQETVMYYISSREGDYYNADLFRQDFETLWATGFFSNIKIEEADGRSGKIVKVTLEENPVIKEIVYKTGKKVKEDDIVTKLKEKDEYILPFSYYSPYKIQRIEKTIKDLLVEKGLPDGTVEIDESSKDATEMEIVFRISEGAKVKVGDVVFEGDPKLRESTLIEAIKDNKEHGLISWIMGKDTFKRNLLDEDLANIKQKLQENGYMEATVGEPKIENYTKRSIFFKKQTMKRIVIPVNAGYRYFVGDIQIEGNKIFTFKGLRRMVPLNEGDIYSTKAREKAVEDMIELYRNFGYLFVQVMPTESLDPKNKRVNLGFRVFEGEMAFLNRLEFKGNTYTKDKVIRREMSMREGDVFSLTYFKNSILRMKQLGLVELEGEPGINPDPEDPTKINVDMRVKELQRNNIQFTAGYSGYEGTFVALSYSTVNFLGAGENLQLMLQTGKLIKNYSFGFTEPYLFDLPMNVGFNIYNRYYKLPWLYNRKDKGIDFTLSARIKGYWQTSLTYGYQDVFVELPQTQSGDDSSLFYDPIYYSMFGLGQYNVSYIMPSIYRNTVDSPLTPTRGSLYMVSVKLAGGPLGGEIDMIKPRFEFTRYQPFITNHVLGFHAEYSFINRTGDTEVPFWERFYMGGERSIRGYNIYTIGPRSEQGTNLGGEKSLIINAEYIMPLGGPLYAILFYDLGNSYGQDEKVSLKNIYTSTGLEMRIFVPALRVPFRLIFSYNNRRIRAGDSNFAFRFAIGTTF